MADQEEREVPARSHRTTMHALLVLAQASFAGFEVLTRFVLVEGVSPYVFAVYRNLLAFLVLFPLSYFMERQERPPFSMAVGWKIAALGFVGVFINQVTYYTGLRFTSATFTSVMLNLIPAFTFILAFVLRLERVRITRTDGQAKVIGTILKGLGALLMIVYKGPAIYRKVSTMHVSEPSQMLGLGAGSWQLGSLSLIITCFSFAVYLTILTPLFRVYPAPLSVAAGAAFCGGIYLAILAVILDSAWALNGTTQIISVFYAGFIASGLVAGIQSWGVRQGGPVIVSAYQPLETTIVALLSIWLLKETLFLGSVIGALLVIIGLCLLVWGQANDRELPAAHMDPLLENGALEEDRELPAAQMDPLLDNGALEEVRELQAAQTDPLLENGALEEDEVDRQ